MDDKHDQAAMVIPFTIASQLIVPQRGPRQVFRGTLWSNVSSLVTISADNPFSETRAYYAGIDRVSFVRRVVEGEFVLVGERNFDDAAWADVRSVLAAFDRQESASKMVWEAFADVICKPENL